MDTTRLVERLQAIEALHAGATTDGERAAAAAARERIQARLRALEAEDPPIEWRFSLPDPWARQMFLALARRYGLEPFRYYRQRRSTVMLRAPRRFVDETLWPEYEALSEELQTWLSRVTEEVIARAIHGDSSEAAVKAEPPRLGGRSGKG